MKAEKDFIEFLRDNDILASGGVFLYDYRDRVFAFLNVHIGSKEGFSKQALEIMHIVQPHLNNLLANLTMPSPLEPEAVTPAELAGGYRVLSKRQTEITGLLCRRFSAHQIGAMLGLSTRTGERHMEHIYEKLGVSNKVDLLKLMTHHREKHKHDKTG